MKRGHLDKERHAERDDDMKTVVHQSQDTHISRARNKPKCLLPRERGPSDTLILGFQPPEHETVDFYCLKPSSLWYFMT